MSWAESFTNVSWSNGDYIEETKLRQMIANDKYNRENSDFRQVLAAAYVWEYDSVSDTWPGTPYLKIDAATTVLDFTGAPAASSTWQTQSAKDVSISGTTEGLHSLDTVTGHAWEWVKTQEIEYLSIWAKYRVKNYAGFLNSWDGHNHYIYEYAITVIGHKTAQGW